MKAEQVDQALIQKFIDNDERLVFWNDPKEEFTDYIQQGLPAELDGVKIHRMSEHGGLASKLLLEREDVEAKYLVYDTREVPAAEADWLLDIRLYSAVFHADVASIWLQQLGLRGLYLRKHLSERAAFLNAQERRKKLKRLIAPADDEAAIDLKMMAVLAGSQVAEFFSILRAICHGHVDDGYDLGREPEVLEVFEKMDLIESFWSRVEHDFGYGPKNPTIAGLLRCLFVSELCHAGVSLPAIAQYELPRTRRQNATVCLTQWRDSAGKAASYDATANAVADEQGLKEQLGDVALDALTDVFTFWEAERGVVRGLRTLALEQSGLPDVAAITSIATRRKAGHWLNGPSSDLPERRAVADAYDAIVAATELFALRTKHQNNLSFSTADEFLVAYRDELYRFDQNYRHFCVKARAAQGLGWDLLKALGAEVEAVYDTGFLQPLGLEWSRLLDDGFLETWKLKEMPPQQDFFAKQIQPYLNESDRKRAYVIISDAFRYEAAQQLTERLNEVYRMDAKLGAMLGVLPSYTTLGMASLLPHERLDYSDKGDVLVDGKSVASTELRNKHLSTVEGLACRSGRTETGLLAMKTDEARAFRGDARCMYIYHNVVDARGDSAPTENETFAAVDDCIDELVELVQFCMNKLNAAKVWVTADHGFLFRQNPMDALDKSELDYKPSHAVKTKKRYVIGDKLGTAPQAHQGSTKVTAGMDDGLDFWVPRGTQRFHFVGGSRFVHGGAMPQEVVVPIVTVTQLRGKKKEGSRSEKVSVQVLGNKHKITTPVHRFEIIQTEPVGERRKPITLRAAVYEGAQAVTSIETVTFDSASASIDERKQSVRLSLATGTFDKSTAYRLVLRDADTDAEVQSIPVEIDRSFDDDF